MAAGVEVSATIRKTGSILYLYCRQGYIRPHCNGQGFAQRLDSVEYSGFRRTGDSDSVTCYFQLVGFGIFGFRSQCQYNSVLTFCSGFDGKVFSCSCFQIVCQELCIALHLFVTFRIKDFHSALQDEGPPLSCNDFLWQGDDLIICFLLRGLARSKKSRHCQASS